MMRIRGRINDEDKRKDQWNPRETRDLSMGSERDAGTIDGIQERRGNFRNVKFRLQSPHAR